MLSVEIHNFLIHEGCPLPRNEMPWCPCPFKKEAYRPVYRNVFAGKTLDCRIYSVDPVLKLVEDSRDSKCLPNIFTRKQNMLSKFFFFLNYNRCSAKSKRLLGYIPKAKILSIKLSQVIILGLLILLFSKDLV